jgi:aryl-alcohol dehydrogenase-like predicted oxidoreductase
MVASPEGTLQYREQSRFQSHFREFESLHLTSLGMGTYLGEADEATDSKVAEAVYESVKSGAINIIDTAINYRYQKAERSVGRALKKLTNDGIAVRDGVFISTKNGYLAPDADAEMDPRTYLTETLIKPGILQVNDIVSGMHCMSRSFLEDQLNRSLRNLDLDAVDLIYLHNAPESQLPVVGREEFFRRLAAAFQFYEEQREKRRISYYGLATWNCFRVSPNHPEFLNLADAVALARRVGGENHGFKFIQLPYNLAMSEANMMSNQNVDGEALSLLKAAVKLHVGVFVSAPMLQGQLLSRIPPRIMNSAALTCLQFVRSTAGVLAPLVGQKESSHVAENLRLAATAPLGEVEMKRIYFGSR